MKKYPLIKIGSKKIGLDHPCFIVAELSGNHHQKLDEAEDLIKAAAGAGADAVKLQTYTPDTITLNSGNKWFVVGSKNSPKSWKNKTLYQLYQKAYTPWDWFPKLKKLAESLNLIFFSTPFDESAVDFLEKLSVPCYKVSSYDVVNIPLLAKISKTKKPVIMSIGFATVDEIQLAIKTLKKHGTSQLALLHCVTAYSNQPNSSEMNLETIKDIQQRFNTVAGFSDNNAGIEVPVQAAFAGASIVEKHFILKRSLGGPDASFSLEPEEFEVMVRRTRDAETVQGKVHYGSASSKEQYNKRYRPSIWVSRDVRKGEKFTKENIRCVRPGNGLPPKYYEKILGLRAKVAIKQATPMSWDVIEKQK